ncbi:hypothetical protein [Aminobacter aminovorans]|uniref:Uncharacterized protein n=1 Tax=Aminobacter aminovorans TaxID=83263 RepID=A0AAC8YMS4_AMIAI|nr:hypothetical protein [Aminobacter aminovorans]AMS41187.1 hypothetical protein AA2016_2259 [Aminobacter aminovorans]MBB3705830.1 hypothetical protein [Aminobacter aminovorans]
MRSDLAAVGAAWEQMIDGLASSQASALRSIAAEMAAKLDETARDDIEGAKEWRDLNKTGNRYDR